MNVRDTRYRIAAAIRDAMPSNYTVAIEPDHPLLLKGPDLIVGGAGNLWAVLIPDARERKDAQQLLVRYTLCRLALRRHTCFVLAIGAEERIFESAQTELLEDGDAIPVEVGHPSGPDVRELVGAVIRTEDSTSVASALDTAHGRVQESPTHVAASVGDRFIVNHRFSLAMALRQERVARGAEARNLPLQQGVRRRLQRDVLEDMEVTLFGDRQPSMAQVYAVMTRTRRDAYYFDGSVPVPRLSLPNIAAARSFPVVGGDPHKALRAAAFANVILVPGEYADFQLDSIVEQIRERFR